MKRKLLFAMLCIVSALGMRAQTWTGNAVGEGKFYLYNVAAEKFLNNGDPNQRWGTNAYLQAGFGMDVQLTLKDGEYTIDTNVSNGGDSHYLANSTWCDGGETKWTFRAVEGQTNVYQIINNGQYIMANEALNDVEMLGDPAGRTTSTYWKLVTENDFKAAMEAKTYSSTDPMDVSIFIKGRSFARNDGRNDTWTTSHTGEPSWVWIGSWNGGSGDPLYFGNEAWNNTFDVHQDITGLPDGTYEVRCSGFGTNGTTYVYGNTTKGQLTTDNTTSQGTDMHAKWKAIHEDNAFANQSSGTFTIGDGNLTVGIKRETNNGGDWCVYDEFRLYYYGLDLSEFAATLAAAVSAAEAVENTVPAAAYTALADVVTAQNKVYNTAADYTTATNAIISATNTAKALQSSYSLYQTVKTAALALDDDATIFTGDATINTTTADTEVEAATTVEGINSAIATLRAAASSFLGSVTVNDGKAFDITNVFITNPAPWATTEGWNCPVEATVNTSAQAAEFWNRSGVSITQELASLPVGYYTLKAQAFARTGCAPIYIFAGAADTDSSDDNIQELIKKSNSEISTMAAAGTWFNNGNGWNTFTYQNETAGSFTIGLKDEFTPNGSHGDNNDGWLIWRQFGLEYLGTEPVSVLADLYDEALAAAEAARDNATYVNVTGSERTALLAAIADTPSATAESYKAKTSALVAATNAFLDDGVLIAYNAYATSYSSGAVHTAKAEADLISTSIYTGLSFVAPATAAEAANKANTDAQAIRVATAEYVATEYHYSLTSKIGDFSTWTRNATYTDGEGTHNDTPQTLRTEHWSATERDYYEQGTNGWGASNGFSATYTKVTTLPAGNYVIKVAARASGDVTGTISTTATTNTVALPNVGAGSKGIDTSGAANFGEGTFANSNKGYGWQWRFLPFTVAADDTEVTITIQESTTATHNWFSLADAELLSDEDKTTKITLEDVSDMASTISSNNGELATVTLNRSIKVGYNTVVLPFDLTAAQVQAVFGAGSTVYSYSENSSDVNSAELFFTKVNAGTITANVPVLVQATSASTSNEIAGVTIESASDAKVEGTNFDYVGVYALTNLAEGDYFLATKEGVQYVFQSDGTDDSAKPFRAYFQKKTTAPVKAVLFIDGVATAIEAIDAQPAEQNGAIFNLAGQRVNKAQRGVYIINGKKVAVK